MNSVQESLEIAQRSWLEMKLKNDDQEELWNKERKKLEDRVEHMKTKNIQLKGDMSNINKINETSMNIKHKEVMDLQEKLRMRDGQFKILRTDLDNKTEEVKDIQDSLNKMRERAERAEKSVDEMKKEKKVKKDKAQTQTKPPVAIQEKPGPEDQGEEEESEDHLDDSTLLQTPGGGVLADTEETDHTFTVPPVPQRRQSGRRRSSKSRGRESSEENSHAEDRDRKRDHQSRRKSSETTQSDDKEELESIKNEMKVQKKKHSKQIEELKDELRRKDLEIKSKEEEITSTVVTPPRMKKGGVVVVQITEENKDRLSNIHNGCLVNEDGTLSRTPMSETWAKNKNHQMVKRYDTTPKKPDYVESIPGHPDPTDLDLDWSHEGE